MPGSWFEKALGERVSVITLHSQALFALHCASPAHTHSCPQLLRTLHCVHCIGMHGQVSSMLPSQVSSLPLAQISSGHIWGGGQFSSMLPSQLSSSLLAQISALGILGLSHLPGHSAAMGQVWTAPWHTPWSLVVHACVVPGTQVQPS